MFEYNIYYWFVVIKINIIFILPLLILKKF